MSKFLNAKDVAYDRPGSVAAHYGFDRNNIDKLMTRFLSGGESDHQRNMRSHVDKFLAKRNASLAKATPGQRIAALDYAIREEGRKQQTKGGGFMGFLKKFIGPAIGTAIGFAVPVIGPAIGGAVGGAIQGGASDGFKGALLGGLQGYGVGSGAGWLAGKAGLTAAAPIIDKSTSISGALTGGGGTATTAPWVHAASAGVNAGASALNNPGGNKPVSILDSILGAAASTAGTAAGSYLISALVGDGGASKSLDQADRLTGQQGALLNQQAAIYSELLKVGKQEREYYLKNYRPVENQLIGQARKGLKPDYEGITNTGAMASREVGRQYDVAQGSYIRGLSRRGVDMDSGERKNMDLSLKMAEAADRAGAFTRGNIDEADKRRTERKYAEEMTYNRRANLVGVGRGVSTTGVNTVSQAASGLGSSASGYGNQASELRTLGQNQAIAAGDSVASVINAGLGLYSQMRNAA